MAEILRDAGVTDEERRQIKTLLSNMLVMSESDRVVLLTVASALKSSAMLRNQENENN